MAARKPKLQPTVYTLCVYNYLIHYGSATSAILSREHKGLTRQGFYMALIRLQEADLVSLTVKIGASGKGLEGHYRLTVRGYKKAHSVLANLHFLD